MPSPFKFRESLTRMWKFIFGKSDIAAESNLSEVDNIEFINEELTLSYRKMAGKKGELRNVSMCMIHCIASCVAQLNNGRV